MEGTVCSVMVIGFRAAYMIEFGAGILGSRCDGKDGGHGYVCGEDCSGACEWLDSGE